MVGQDQSEAEKWFVKSLIGAMIFIAGLFGMGITVIKKSPSHDILNCVPEGIAKYVFAALMILGAVIVWWSLRSGKRSELEMMRNR